MDLEKVLRDAAENVLSDQLNETQVRTSVINPILRGLDWNDGSPEEFKVEFSVNDVGRVDYALCKDSKPLVFIEAKRLGHADVHGQEQLFNYANNQGVPLLILTDGNVWNFYLSMAAGIPSERQFYRMELQRRDKIPEYIKILNLILRKERVFSKEAKRSAEDLHEGENMKKKAREAIPDIWQSLLKEPSENLRELIAESVEGEVGTKPELDDVEEFLREISSSYSSGYDIKISSNSSRRLNRATKTSDVNPVKHQGKIIAFILDGERYEGKTANGSLVKLLMEFQRRDSGFMTRFASESAGRKRQLVARNPQDLYPGSPHLMEKHSLEIGEGWWLGTNNATRDVRRHIETACQVAGIKFGAELTLVEQ